jgi:hypothetical protein
MNTKLTLTLDSNIIQHAKIYAKKHNISLSKMVEFYFQSFIDKLYENKRVEHKKAPPITQELSGIAKLNSQKTDKELLIEALNKKYL